jgi:para-aminobenzoate synthetase/4-amino-4-deoxychorismate lyase
VPARVPLDIADGTDAGAVLAALYDGGHAFALEGVWAGGGALVGVGPERVARPDEDPLALLGAPATATAGAPEGFVGGGWFGWLGFGLGRRIEPVPPPPPAPVPAPAFALARYDRVLRRLPDGRWWMEALDGTGAGERAAAIAARVAGRAPAAAPAPGPVLAVAPGSHHVAAVADGVRRIAEGELFQANLCLRLEAAWEGDPVALYRRAAAALRPAYGGVFLRPGGAVISLSPELFLRREGDRVRSGPIKGTAPAAPGAAGRLRASAKDAAEHVMIVDLMRNDLGRVCVYGSITADATPRLEDHVGVHHP